jgi:hypothetical protein
MKYTIAFSRIKEKPGACKWEENYGNENGERFFLRGKK